MIEGFELVLLTLMNWVHLFATVAWFGAITTMFFVLLPAAKVALEPPVMGKLMGVLAKKMKVVAYLSGIVLIVTGVVMQILSPSNAVYSFGTRWGMVLVVKHILVAIMIFVGVYVSESIMPKIAKLAAKGLSPEVGALQKKQMKLGMFNFILSLIILLLSGYLRLLT